MFHIHDKIYLILGSVLLILFALQVLYMRMKLKSAGRKYQTLLENAGDAVVIIDKKGKLIHASTSIFKVLGYTVKEACNLDVMALAHPDDIPVLQAVMARVMENPGIPVRGHTGRMMHRDGTWHWYEAVVTNMLHDPDIRGIVDNFRDVSENVYAIEKMNNANRLYAFTSQKNRDSEIRLKQAQSIAHVGSFEIDFATNISTWSEELCRIYGYAIEDNKHHYDKWMEMIHPDDLQHVKAIVAEAKRSLSSSAIYHRIIRSGDGSVRHIFSQGEYEFDEQGKVIGLHGVAHDITDQKHAELERIKMIADLTQRNKDLEQFSYVVSHNVRAPLANIISLIGLLDHSTLGPDGKEVFDALNESTGKLDYVIKDLNLILNMNRKIDEKKEFVSFEALMSDIKISIANLITAGKAELTSNFSAIGQIHTFKSYLHSIFYNLILNSIKYRRPDFPAMIHVSSKIEKGRLILEFSDNGIGIDLERHHSQLFGLYKRFHPHIEGKGMGLYMVKMQVEQLHGKITVESEVDKGTTFKIVFIL